MERDQAIRLVQQLLTLLKAKNGSDLFITAGFPPAIKVDGQVTPVMDKPVSSENAALIVRSLMADRQIKEFESTNECQFAISPPGIGRFRVSAFVQQGSVGAVMRVITTTIPTFEQLGLPEQLKNIAMAKRGLVIMVGATGSGKSTSLAAMLGYRNVNSKGHIITIEDPIEYVHAHAGCMVTQREIGIDTHSWDNALKNTLRQAPDVIQIGEVRTRETMEYAVHFAETGHLVLTTLHANSANSALDRIINFFPEEKREQLLMDLGLNLRAIISQRLVRRETGGRAAAMEILLNTPLVADMIFKGEVAELKEVMGRSNEQGMITFDQFLFDMFEHKVINYEEAIRNADSQNEVRLRIKLESKRAAQNLLEDEVVKKMTMQKDEDAGQILRR
ncbi:twitching motility protein PilU [Panacagrimonas perspica]|uniref:Twitching motility protein PilU n=1 Tax=Panacagrimonas perspica TaxID=381431 RepID=A0A4S3K2L9_9GAMM|nr:PilT/PilU family type 4a pilus ATPase [Panacagrimonas perspica]TDU30878.1 twitching motility protein PilU [Panacagrimonas perspica]THD01964.1 type IV pili twitching motility protein PilT [Panacagrimonas perspica]